ncbi:hypothetical protein QFZ97_007249 [Paraburkholderia youngii]
MSAIDRYVEAATRENTRRSYQSALRHFEVEWGGFLPASAEMIARYLADHAETLSVNTLRSRLAALAQWHQTQGFPDPTKAPHVRKVLRGIVALHPASEKRAKPMQLAQLEKLTAWRDQQITREADGHERLACIRNRALVLLGFWRGFRSDELSRLQIEHVAVEAGRGMTLYLPRTKGDRAAGHDLQGPGAFTPVSGGGLRGVDCGVRPDGRTRIPEHRPLGKHQRRGTACRQLRAAVACAFPCSRPGRAGQLQQPFATAGLRNVGQLERLGSEDADAVRWLERRAFRDALHRCRRSVRATPHRIGTRNTRYDRAGATRHRIA